MGVSSAKVSKVRAGRGALGVSFSFRFLVCFLTVELLGVEAGSALDEDVRGELIELAMEGEVVEEEVEEFENIWVD